MHIMLYTLPCQCIRHCRTIGTHLILFGVVSFPPEIVPADYYYHHLKPLLLMSFALSLSILHCFGYTTTTITINTIADVVAVASTTNIVSTIAVNPASIVTMSFSVLQLHVQLLQQLLR